jgi:hypothetical protein
MTVVETYTAFQPVVIKGNYYGHERGSQILDELKPLYERNWEETEGWQGTDIDLNMDRYLELEATQRLLTFTARNSDRELVGYLIYRLGKSLQNKGHTRASEEVFYVVPEMRGIRAGGVALHLLNFAEKALIEIGITMFEQMDKSPLGNASLKRTLERRGYVAVSVSYMKLVGEPHE